MSNNKDIYYQKTAFDASSTVRVTNTGGWCIDNPRVMGTVYPGKSTGCIYNGVPEWNYEEEMISTTNTIYWAPNSEMFAFLAFDISDIDLLEYSVFPQNVAANSPDDELKSPDDIEQYPRVNRIKYAKATRNITTTKFYLTKVVETQKLAEGQTVEYNKVGDFPFEVGTGGDQENRYFAHLQWAADSSWFLMSWISRAATESQAIGCNVADGNIENAECRVLAGKSVESQASITPMESGSIKRVDSMEDGSDLFSRLFRN